jgi:hypothetical protein
MGKIFIINDTSITGGVASTHDIGTTSLTWKDGYFSGTVTVGTTSVTGAVIGNSGSFATTITVGTVSATGNIISGAKVSAASGSFTALLTAGTASFSGNFTVVGTSSIGNVTFADNRTILVGTGTGLTFATGTNQKLGFYGATPIVQSAAYTTSNVSTDRSFDANSTTLDELSDVVGTLIADLRALGILG